MKKPVNGTRFLVLLLLTTLLGETVPAQGPGQRPLAAQGTTNAVQLPNPTGSDPKPEDASKAILAAFDNYEVVGMGAAHGNKDMDDFILHLIRDPAFPSKVNDVAVECGNSLYQPILDRYIAGDDVALSEVRQVWRNTTQPMCGVSSFYEELFPLVRRINQKLPPEKELRVLAGDPPIDWSKVKSFEDFGQFLMRRDATTASVMEKEVLSRHRKALMLFGTAHLFHHGNVAGIQPAVELYEKDYPGLTLVIGDHAGFGNWTAPARYNEELEARMVGWPVPSLVQQLKGTWLANLDETYFSRTVDAYLYLGPRDLLLREPAPADIFLDKDYMAELQRRAATMGAGPITDQADPGKLSEHDSNPFLYDPDQLRRMVQPIGTNSSQSGSGTQAGPPSRTPPTNP